MCTLPCRLVIIPTKHPMLIPFLFLFFQFLSTAPPSMYFCVRDISKTVEHFAFISKISIPHTTQKAGDLKLQIPALTYRGHCICGCPHPQPMILPLSLMLHIKEVSHMFPPLSQFIYSDILPSVVPVFHEPRHLY